MFSQLDQSSADLHQKSFLLSGTARSESAWTEYSGRHGGKAHFHDKQKMCIRDRDVPAVKNQKIMTISYDEFMDYGPAVIDSLEKINDFVNK